MGLLSFLKTAEVAEIVEPAKRSGAKGKQRNPKPAILAIRVWKDGSVYPSAALVSAFGLDYVSGTPVTIPAVAQVGKEGEEGYKAAKAEKTTTEIKGSAGFGFDVIDSRVWPGYKAEGHMLFIAPVERGVNPKIDLFASTTYDKDGTPKSTVMDQGAVTFGKDVLIDAIEELYGITFAKKNDNGEEMEGVEFVDMMVLSEITEGDDTLNINETFSKPILHMPKTVTRGADKGKSDYVRRENSTVYAFVPASVLAGGAVEEDDLLDEDEDLVEETTEIEA